MTQTRTLFEVDRLYWIWQEFAREADRIMDNGGTALDVRTSAAVAKEAYLRASEADAPQLGNKS